MLTQKIRVFSSLFGVLRSSTIQVTIILKNNNNLLHSLVSLACDSSLRTLEFLHRVKYLCAEEKSSGHGEFRAESALLHTCVSRYTHGRVRLGDVRKYDNQDSVVGCGTWRVKGEKKWKLCRQGASFKNNSWKLQNALKRSRLCLE